MTVANKTRSSAAAEKLYYTLTNHKHSQLATNVHIMNIHFSQIQLKLFL